MGAAVFCTVCGAPRTPGDAFCRRCGTPFASPGVAPAIPGTPAAPVSPLPHAVGTATTGSPVTGRMVRERIQNSAFILVLVGLIGYLDWLTYGNISLDIVAVLVVVAIVSFKPEIVKALNLQPTLDQIPKPVRQLLVALPPVLWFPLRGEGLSGAGFIVSITALAMVAIVSFFGPRIDGVLAGFYQARNRVVPRVARLMLSVVAPILIAFAVVHGSLKALPTLFQGTTQSPSSAGGKPFLYFLGTLLSGISAFLLLREKEGS